MGTGKTTFARFFINKLALKNKKKIKNIISPTYNLIQNYNCGKKNLVCHIDLYRLENIKEIMNIGLIEEIENKIALIEWPEKVKEIINERIEISFYYNLENIKERKLVLKAIGKKNKDKLKLLKLKKIE